MYCDKCGANILDDSIFCNKCGNTLTVEEKSEKTVSLKSRSGVFNITLFLLLIVMICALFFLGRRVLLLINEEKKYDDLAEGENNKYTVVSPQIDYNYDDYLFAKQEEFNIVQPLEETSAGFYVLDEIEEADFSSGKVQIGNNIYYLGDPLSEWISKDVYITDNTTGYPGVTALAYDGEPVARVYLRDNGGVLLQDCAVKGIFFGIQYNADISQRNADIHLANPEPIALPGGLYIGRDFSEIQDKYGDYLHDDTEHVYKTEIKIYRFTKEYKDSFEGFTPTIYVDRVNGKICGLYWETTY